MQLKKMCPKCKEPAAKVEILEHFNLGVRQYRMVWECPRCGKFEDYVISYKKGERNGKKKKK